VQPGALRGAPAPLAGHDLELVAGAADGAHQDWLHNALLAHRSGEIVKVGIGEGLARVARIGAQERDRQAPLLTPSPSPFTPRYGLRQDHRAHNPDQRRETAPQSAARCIFCHSISSIAAIPPPNRFWG
jgi:hypothetical protein